MQQCCVASWKALLHVLPPTSNIVTQQNFVVASWSSMLHQVEVASTFFNKFFQLATTNFVAWQCLRWVVIRPTTLFNLQCNNVALQVAAICCSYYFTLRLFMQFVIILSHTYLCVSCLIFSSMYFCIDLVKMFPVLARQRLSQLWIISSNYIKRGGIFQLCCKIFIHSTFARANSLHLGK